MSGANPVQSVDRVFDIIEALGQNPRGMSLTGLSNDVGLHSSTTHRLVTSLINRGYVYKTIDTGKYALTTKLLQVGTRVVDSMNLVSIARPYLEELADFTSETVHLVARRADEVVYLYKEDTNNSIVRMASFVGSVAPMYCTGVGKCILANLSPKEIAAIWGRTDVVAYTENTITDFSALEEELRRIRQNGYGEDCEEHEKGVACVAAPIFDYTGSPVAAISVSFPTSRITAQRRQAFSQQIVKSCSAISTVLGYVGSLQ